MGNVDTACCPWVEDGASRWRGVEVVFADLIAIDKGIGAYDDPLNTVMGLSDLCS